MFNNVQLQCSTYWLLWCLALNHIDFQAFFQNGLPSEGFVFVREDETIFTFFSQNNTTKKFKSC